MRAGLGDADDAKHTAKRVNSGVWPVSDQLLPRISALQMVPCSATNIVSGNSLGHNETVVSETIKGDTVE